MYKIIGADQKEYGPISAEVLRQWLAEGRVNASTKVQAEGTEEWKPLSQIPEFALTTPPPLTPFAPTLPPPPQAASTNNMAIWAFGVSLFGMFCCQILSVAGLVLGIIAVNQCNKDPNKTGKGFAIAAIIIGVVSLIISVIIGVIYFSIAADAFRHGFPH